MQAYNEKGFADSEIICAADIDIRAKAPSNRRLYTIGKRGIDIALAMAGIVFLSPLMLLICLAVWLDDPHGNPIYVSKRCGKEGRFFSFYKFRSMCMDAETHRLHLVDLNEMDGPVFKIKNDPRITRVGRVIRKLNLDELPQLFNVLAGQMSLVGPRPPLPDEVLEYTPYQAQRLSVTPGLTCLWQVQPSRNDLSFNDWIELDLEYISRRNMWLDIKLILKTMLVVLRGEGR